MVIPPAILGMKATRWVAFSKGIVTRPVPGYTRYVIRSFSHKGLERFFLTGSGASIQAHHAAKLRLILGRLQASASPRDMRLPGLSLHELSGDRKGIWSVKVSGNWRVTFRFTENGAEAVDYEDYH